MLKLNHDLDSDSKLFWGELTCIAHERCLAAKQMVLGVSSLAVRLQASYHGVPIVGMALVGEQPDNLARAVDRGDGLTVNVKKLGSLAQDLEKALKRILGDPSFKANAARIMRAHRLSPAGKAAGKFELLAISRLPAQGTASHFTNVFAMYAN